jgi:uncharacterized membrane protein YfcA
MNYRALFASPLGFLIGLSLGTLGGGGSILAVPALVYAAGQDPKAATASSLLLVGVAACVGIWPHLRNGRVRVKLGVMFGVAGIPGSLIGSSINKHVDPNVLLVGFSILILVAAWRMVTGCPSCTKIGEERVMAEGSASGTHAEKLDAKAALAIVGAGTAVGFLTGLFGVGGGFIVVPALTLLLAIPMPVAIGTSLLIITINSAVALATRMATTTIQWGVTLPFTIAAVFGVLTGGKIANTLDPKKSLRWFAALLVCVAIYTATDAITGLVA